METRTIIRRGILLGILMIVAMTGLNILLSIIKSFAKAVESITPVMGIIGTQDQISIETIVNVAIWCSYGIWTIMMILVILAIFPIKKQ